jgi:hypothetical protein
MGKLLLIFFFWSLDARAQLNCLNKLLPFSSSSGQHQLTKEEWRDNKEQLDAASAEDGLKYLILKKLFCRPEELQIKINAHCLHIVRDIEQSNTCFVFTNLGYFIIAKDRAQTLNFIFSRDARFNEY